MKHKCDNCGRKWHIDSLETIKDYWMRVDEDGPVPSGECPECGCLCYPVKGKKKATKKFERNGKKRGRPMTEQEAWCACGISQADYQEYFDAFVNRYHGLKA